MKDGKNMHLLYGRVMDLCPFKGACLVSGKIFKI
jgi:hypothetical protein